MTLLLMFLTHALRCMRVIWCLMLSALSDAAFLLRCRLEKEKGGEREMGGGGIVGGRVCVKREKKENGKGLGSGGWRARVGKE